MRQRLKWCETVPVVACCQISLQLLRQKGLIYGAKQSAEHKRLAPEGVSL